MTLVDGSVTLDDVTLPNTFPIELGSIDAGQTKTVKFKVVATSIPQTNPVFNTARIDYNFEPFVDFTVQTFTNSNVTNVFIVDAEVSITKLVDKAIASQGEQLT